MDRTNKIERLKDELNGTDYIVLKAYEGHDVSEHGDYVGYRQGLRDEINRLMAMTDEEYWEAYPDEKPEEPIVIEEEVEEEPIPDNDEELVN